MNNAALDILVHGCESLSKVLRNGKPGSKDTYEFYLTNNDILSSKMIVSIYSRARAVQLLILPNTCLSFILAILAGIYWISMQF